MSLKIAGNENAKDVLRAHLSEKWITSNQDEHDP